MQLESLYKNYYKELLSIKDTLKKYTITDYSSPLLMTCSDDYENSNNRILYIGKETNSWYEGGDKALSTQNPITHILDFYNDFSLGENDNRIFWRFIKQCNKKLSVKRKAFLWTNVNKFGKAHGRGRPDQKVLDLENYKFNILKDEIDIIKPNVIIFLSGKDGYDDEIKRKLGNNTIFKDIPNLQCFSKVINPILPEKTFRIYHPLYLWRKKLFDTYISKLHQLINF